MGKKEVIKDSLYGGRNKWMYAYFKNETPFIAIGHNKRAYQMVISKNSLLRIMPIDKKRESRLKDKQCLKK